MKLNSYSEEANIKTYAAWIMLTNSIEYKVFLIRKVVTFNQWTIVILLFDTRLYLMKILKVRVKFLYFNFMITSSNRNSNCHWSHCFDHDGLLSPFHFTTPEKMFLFTVNWSNCFSGYTSLLRDWWGIK